MRLFVAGQKYFGAAVLRLCLELGHDVLGVSAPHAGDKLWRMAESAGVGVIPTLRAESLPPKTDLIIAAHSHDFIGRKTRLKSKLGAIGYHPSLLPRHRGRDAVAWAIRMGDCVTGGSVYWLDDNVDGGDIAAQDWCWIRPKDTAAELWRRDLQPMGLRLIASVLRDLESGTITAISQDDTLATWEPSIGRPPIFRPELPQLGCRSGYTVIRQLAK